MYTDLSNIKTLVQELEKGNHQALVFLMNTYHHQLCLYAYSLSNDFDGAKDIVQNVFVKIWEDKHKLQHVKSIKSFLYKSVYNGFIDQWRKDKKMLAIEQKHFEALEDIVKNENADVLKKQLSLVKLEIQRLPPKCKETFLLSKQEGLTNIEIANFMNVSIRTVEAQMNKAFRILRKKLQNKIKPMLFLLFGINFHVES
ncbi:RNA polymerase sigma factor [Flavivirga spongiicola]|uniref:Sigma-70 family RNA polymerase sigma factor n=1 Tax=Flavivirga spongiicola TaxID=421621 RepID=A0ABU7XN40_9FLAO|nr:sigma-70 family RNA polymerase sigma factor [Flavivirga sp. MEBiC05379]MDO5981824.1 sigma-70 family RNA polymerase sigma factor [Flavivirga sp. MEBiC05379]